MADYDIGAAFEQIEDELLSSMTRNLKRHTVEEITEGYEWTQWQVLQLQALEDYKRRARAKYGTTFSSINDRIEESITDSYTTAQTEQEKEILRQIRNDLPEPAVTVQGIGSFTGEFFKTNDRKLDALIKATTDDMQRAETAVLRMTNDKYRSIIFNAQVYANTGAGTYAKAVDMATKDFLSAGINCIEYKNGRRVNIRSYAEMALRTANKRAYLQGEGEMRKKWGIHTVILNKRTNACPKCTPFVGKVIVDDVWSGGTPEEATKSGYLLMSECIAQGLYHPNCRDSHTTYFGDILDEEDNGEQAEIIQNDESTFTPEEQKLNEQLYEAEQRENYCNRQVQRFERLSEYSLDEGNIREYRARERDWTEKLAQSRDTVESIKEQITLNEEKQLQKQPKHKGKKPSVIGAMIGKNVMSDAVQRLSFDTENPRENEEKTVANSQESQVSYIDVTDEYLSNATPGVGAITQDRDLQHKKHLEEIQFANWLLNTFGGSIHINQEHADKKYPDYIWNGKLWDLKSVTTERAANNAVKSGHKQIKDNPGGIMIDFGDNTFVIENLEKEIEDRLKWYHNVQFDIMIVHKSKVEKIIRYKK